MRHAPNRTCPDAEMLAAFADGRLKGADAAAVVAHLDTCEKCLGDLALGMKAAEEESVVSSSGVLGSSELLGADAPLAKNPRNPEEPRNSEEPSNVIRPRRWMPWLAAAAAAIVLVLLLPVVRDALRRSPVERLVELAPRSARMVEPRLTGGFEWSPYRGIARSGGAAADPEQMKLVGAAGELMERAQHDTSTEAQHGAGVAMLLTQNSDDAIGRLETAAKTAESERIWSDLAAARYAAASDHGRAALYPRALAAADEALRLDPKLTEALFNRALILERMGLVNDARNAWARYLAVDPSSKWAEEARTRLGELPAENQSRRFERDRPAIENAAARGDAKVLRTLLAAHAARARAYAEAEYLGRWGEAVLQKKDTDAERWLRISREIGAVVAETRNDMLLRDAVRAIDGLPASERNAIAAAHVAYRAGRIAYSRQKLDVARTELARAAELFTRTRSPMALAARYYIAGIAQAQHDAHAGAELERVLAAVDATPAYRSLRAHVRWELGRARVFDYDWTRAIAVLTESAAMFREVDDRTNEAFVEAIVAYCLAAEGRGDDSWSSRILALRALSAEGNQARLAAAINGAMRADFLAGRRDAALALARLPQPVAKDEEQLSLVLDALRFESMLESQGGNAAVALQTAKRATALAQGIGDASLRALRLADIDVAMGAAVAASDPGGALAPLTRAIDFYRREERPFALPEPLLLRARCALRAGNATAAARDLEEGMQIVERHRTGTTAAAGTGILDADHALFTDAMRLHLDRGDEAAAFAIAERARGASIGVQELQKRLAGSATAVLGIALLPGEVVTFAVTEDGMQTVRRRTDLARLAQLAEASLAESGTNAATALYDELIRPIDGPLSRVQRVIIVPDPRLERVPFAALYDRQRGTHLVERLRVATAASAASLQREDLRGGVRADASLVTMTLPTGGTTGTATLAQTESEATDIGALYPHATAIAAGQATLPALRAALSNADVVHVAGHTQRQPAGGEHALMLTGSTDDGVERASSKTIAATPLPRARLLVLAACETLRPPASTETRALSLGGAFAAAGVADVIGTLTPVGDRDARTFFRDLHRHLAAGHGAADALRAAQVAAIRKHDTAWRSMSLLTRRIVTAKGT
jgi:CHAT domain-containing protein/tetratricopeptide (TPR) repeat protein